MSGSCRVALKSFGCKTNHEEMAALRARLRPEEGFTISEDLRSADVIIVNTCCVTGNAESKSRRLVRSLNNTAPHAAVLVTGCLAQHDPHHFTETDNIQWVVGNFNKKDIPSILKAKTPGIFHSACSQDPGLLHYPGLNNLDTLKGGPVDSLLTRFHLKIQEGCNNACTYCIVPSVRGPSRCVPCASILEQAAAAVESGYKEIVLTGTHIGQYRTPEGHHLTTLIHDLIKLPGDFRIRLSSIDPRELDDDLLDLLMSQPRICPHLHLSVQSFSPRILSLMNRPCDDVEKIVSRLSGLRGSHTEIALGGDFIVGFPGETTQEFNETLIRAQQAGFTYGHVFRYSERAGTPAPALPGTIPEAIRRERWQVLTQALDEANARFIRSLSGTRHRIIIEETEPATGVTGNYLHISLAGQSLSHNSWVDVIIDSPSAEGKNRGTGHPV